MRKAIIAAAVATIALAPIRMATPVASASPCGLLSKYSTDARTQWSEYPPACKACILANSQDTACFDKASPPAAPPNTMPAQTPQIKPPPNTAPLQTPHVKPPPAPTTVPVITPKINPPRPGAPKNVPTVTAPKHVHAPQEKIAKAKTAPPTRIDPANPPKPSTPIDFNRQVQNVIGAHNGNVEVVTAGNQALARPRVWDYLDYDDYHRPRLYNPLDKAMTFRYFYNGAYRDIYLPAGGRTVLDVATAGVFPFTAVTDSYLAAGSFTGGAFIPPDGWDGPPPPDYTPPAAPEVYQDVSANVPADNQTVQVGQVTVIGHDDSLPTGSQDTFMLDDSTLAWGQVNPANGAQISVSKTQSLPGVGPMDNGSFLVALAAHEQPTDNTWWLWPLGGGVLVIAVGLATWLVILRKRNAAV